jgi:serine phosphatase RsbU (regulator of sigma subunit)
MASSKILIVDDEEFNVDYLEQELEDIGCETDSAENGLDALQKIQAEPPDLVLLDIMMPVMDGFEVLSRLKSDPATRDIPIIVISAESNLQSVVRGIQLGAEDYLPKPFEPTLLRARIASSLEKKHLRDLQQLYLKNMERELEIGRNIQQGFLPSELPSLPGWEVAAWFKAAHEVAGDFYDAFELPDGNLAFVVGDVCDKGVGAALFMTLFRSLIRATSTSTLSSGGLDVASLEPAERLRHVITFTNNYIATTHGDANMFATIFMGIVNRLDGKLTYVNCGNEPPLLLAHGGVTPLPSTGPAIGIIPDAKFLIKDVALAASDRLVAFTDGIPDALNGDSLSFGNEGLLNLLKGGDTSAGELIETIKDRLRRFIGAADQFDDITLLVVKRADAATI